MQKEGATCGGSRWPWGFDGSEVLKGNWVGEAAKSDFDGEPGIIVGREVGGTSNNYPGAGRRFGETARIVGGNDPLRFRAKPASKCRSGQ